VGVSHPSNPSERQAPGRMDDDGDGYEGAASGVDPDDPKASAEFSTPDATMFVIEATKRMFTQTFPGGGLPLLYVALQAAVECMTDRVLASEKDLVGVVLYGTNGKQNDRGFDHVWELVPLAEPSARTIRMLRDHIKEVEVFGDSKLQKECEGSLGSGVDLDDVLLYTQLTFNLKSTKKKYQKRVFLFTCDEQLGASAEAKEVAMTKASDMRDSEIRIEPFFLCPSDQPSFDTEAFWRAVISNNRPAPEAAPELALTVCDRDASAVQGLARRASAKMRAYTHVRLILPGDQEIGLTLYKIVSKKTKPTAKKLVSATNEEVKMQTRLLNANDGQILNPEFDIGHLVKVGDNVAIFEGGEKDQLTKASGEKRVCVVGFKSRDRLKPYHVRGNGGYFAVPDESSHTGSTAACRALIDVLLKRDKMAIAAYVNKQSVLMTALVPQREALADDGAVELPFGFHVIPLPFSDDLRMPPLEYKPDEPSAEAVASAGDLVSKMRVPYTLRKSPILECFYGCLEAYALGETSLPTVVDDTRPDEQLALRCAGVVESFKEAVFGDEYAEPTVAKRAAASGDGAVKRLKTGPPESPEDWRKLADDDQLGRLTADVLKEYCKAHDLKKTGKKDELTARVREHILNA